MTITLDVTLEEIYKALRSNTICKCGYECLPSLLGHVKIKEIKDEEEILQNTL